MEGGPAPRRAKLGCVYQTAIAITAKHRVADLNDVQNDICPPRSVSVFRNVQPCRIFHQQHSLVPRARENGRQPHKTHSCGSPAFSS